VSLAKLMCGAITMTGTDQVRFYTLDGDLLDILTGVHTMLLLILSLTYYTHNCLGDHPGLFCV
jgi:hypothetical protein